MEKYKIYFMLFSSIYLFIFGFFLKRKNTTNRGKVLTLITILFSIFSLISATISCFNNKLGESLYDIFVVILITLCVGISIINLLVKKKSSL
jgi:drug/metabolite transporter superfamily protein YnfA